MRSCQACAEDPNYGYAASCTLLDRHVSIWPADIELTSAPWFSRDAFVFELPGGRRPDWRENSKLLLAVEVVSPSTARADRNLKRRYQGHRIPEYWIVHLDARLVERRRPGDDRPEILSETLICNPAESSAAFELDLTQFFAEVLDPSL